MEICTSSNPTNWQEYLPTIYWTCCPRCQRRSKRPRLCLQKPSCGMHTRGHTAHVRSGAMRWGRESVECQVIAANKQIDALVYGLYGLMDEAMRIVEVL